MIPRLGDGNVKKVISMRIDGKCLENDSPSRGRKPTFLAVDCAALSAVFRK